VSQGMQVPAEQKAWITTSKAKSG